MSDEAPKYKKLRQTVDSEHYRTDTSTLLAYDEGIGQFLFRALNSNYFLQDDQKESIEVLDMDEAEKAYDRMPNKHISNIVAAFPKYHGGVGLDTYTNLYDD
ncbi:MAG: hypothetical protein OXK72_05160 [Gammaproteobacteria bacterium]|nr:hypothetical protein [Gammaproteobacteria bacterium]MDE0410982.1 hypothetical protein [Gammaproteobacteria bacterium]